MTSEERSKVIEMKKQQGYYKAEDKKGLKRKASSVESNTDKDEDPVETDGDSAANSYGSSCGSRR